MAKKWYAKKRDWTKRFDFEIISWSGPLLKVKITSWENKGKYSYIYEEEIDKYLVFLE